MIKLFVITPHSKYNILWTFLISAIKLIGYWLQG